MGRTPEVPTPDEAEASAYPIESQNIVAGEVYYLSGPRPVPGSGLRRSWFPDAIRARQVTRAARRAALFTGQRVFVWNRHQEIVWTVAAPPRRDPRFIRDIDTFYWSPNK